MTANLARQLIENCGALLLDFDGPMTTLLPAPLNAELAWASKQPLISAGVDLPLEVKETTDHLEVLRWTAANAPRLIAEVERIASEGEVSAAQSSPITDGLPELVARYGHKTVVVTNNAPQAARAMLSRLDPASSSIPICGRPDAHPELMKPAPHLVSLAARKAGERPSRCVMVGDHATDVQATHAAGARSVGFAKSPRHRKQLEDANTEAIMVSWRDVLS